jgi:hypothetical protein
MEVKNSKGYRIQNAARASRDETTNINCLKPSLQRLIFGAQQRI